MSSESRVPAEADTVVRYHEYLRSPIKALLEHSVLLVSMCTVIGAGAQVLLKIGASQIPSANPINILLNPYLFTGYALYGMSTILLILALRKGHLSLLYPVISLTYVWVTILSVLIFHEAVNPYKGVGLAIIVAGVGILGRDARA